MSPELAQQLSEKTRLDYDALAEAMDATRREVWDELRDVIPAFRPNDRVIDIGCGNGRMVQALTGSIPNRRLSVRNYVGIDASSELIKRAQNHYPQSTFMVGDARALPFPDASFDHAFCIAVLHQVPGEKAREEALREATRVLKPGGTLLITVWNLWRPAYIRYVLESTLKKLLGQHHMDYGDVLIPWKGKGVERYYHAFRASTVRKLLADSGFEIISERHGRNLVFAARKRS